MWLKVPGFGDKVKEWWTSYGVSGTPSFRLSKKFKLLTGDIIRWNKEVFGRVEVKMRELMHELGELERGEGARELDESEKARLGVAVANRRRNFIESLVVDGVRIEGEKEVKGAIVGFYENLYKEEVSWRPTLEGIEFNHIGEGDSEWLERAFVEEEVHEAVTSCAGDKAPGPDGFSLAFF
ncbi:uncharacterized protein LOC107828553 [Nicotiana tabacum]|uniref:Uncharacterized protein LOC107828553 n=1 Tax=Nicotiana tabacum TaxID=4097 RepID=A0A1S4DD97_TOBAC|nr:PREDICTED: uncharacterized protein LOC107828553 [Nicotiana tabacum]